LFRRGPEKRSAESAYADPFLFFGRHRITVWCGVVWCDAMRCGAACAPWRSRVQMVFQDPHDSLDSRRTASDAIACW